MIEKRDVGFRKINGHSDDAWNDLADSLAVRGRNGQAKEVVIHQVVRVVINKKEKSTCFDRFSIHALANMYDFWPRLVAKCGDVIGAPEDYEVWHNRFKLARPLAMGEQYEIISKRTPGFISPSELIAQRLSSFDFEVLSPLRVALPHSGKACEAPQVTPHPRISEQEVSRDVPQRMRVSASFQNQSGSSRERRFWYTDEDTEDSLERKARSGLGIVGSWRSLSFWRDHEGVRLVITNIRKEVTLRFYLPGEPEIQEIPIGWNETPASFLVRIGKKDNYHIMDANGQEFPKEDNLFGYATLSNALQVNIVHGMTRRESSLL
jgi:hypothetical protein